ncbi:unnamed protein product [Meloidogyne enterolobii]|uniref:Uncharacterized protein n=1 Tax=Meloidogyne enterolobii TaxID=390850 RepID=A0ACB1AQT9_MELEN
MLERVGDLWTCQCPPGFQGSQCESEINACLNVTCKHKGKCVNLGGIDFRCDCAPGWSGHVCEINIDDCENIVCLNGGVCVDRVNNYLCECARGFAGRHCEIFVPVDKFNRTDMVDMDNCRRQGCEQKATNGKCDPECNLYACQFDGGECSTRQINPFEKCPQPSYCSHSFSNGKCDEVCNNERCLFDGFDCLPRPLAKCPRLAECALRYANGQCDQQCNMAACGWDGGDCDHDVEPESHVLLGELVLVLAVQPEELFPNLLRQFLLSLSSHLRVSLSLSVDEEGKPNLFRWSQDSGIGKRIDLPPGMNVTTMFSVHYYDSDIVVGEEEGKNKNEIVQDRRRKRNLNDISKKEGVALFLRVDVTMCNLLDSSSSSTSMPRIIHQHQIPEHPHRHHHHIYHSSNKLLGVHEPCFSHMDSVAAYALQDIGVPILQSEARLSPHSSSKSYGLFWCVLLTLMFSLVIGSVIIIRRPKNNKMKTAKTWRPPIVEQPSSKFGSSSTLASHYPLHPQQPQLTLRASSIWPNYPVAPSSSCASSNMPLMINHAVSMNSLSNQSNIYSQHNHPQQYQNPVNSMMQMSNNNNQHLHQQPTKHYRQHPYLPQHSLQQHSSTLPRNNGNCWTTATTTTDLIGENKNLLTTSSNQNLNSSIHYRQQQPQLLIGATGNVNGIATLPLPNNNTNNIYNNQQQQNMPSLGNGGELPSTHPTTTTIATTIVNNNNNSTSYSRCSSSGIGGSSTEHSPLGQLLPLHCSSTNIVVDPSLVGNNNENEEQRKLIKELQDFLMFKRRALLDCNSEIISRLKKWMVDSTNERGRTFLHLLFQNMFLMTANDNETDLLANIDILFKSGVSIDAQDHDGTTALSLAVRNRKFRAVKKLIVDCDADANLPDLDNKSPLYHICANLSTQEDLEIAEFLINGVADLKLDTLARETETPLIRCAALCNPFSLRIAELLISRVEASQRIEFVNYSGKTLSTALHRAASVGNEQMVRLLIKHGANKESTDKEGKSPLFVAVEQAQYETVSVLLELGADRNKSDMNDTKIMELASQPGFEPISQLFRKFPENQNNHHQHIQFFNSSTRSSSTPKDQQKNQNGKRQRVGTKRRNTATTTNNSSSNSILQVIQRGVNSVLLPSNNKEINNYEDGSSAAKKRAPIIISNNNNNPNISPPCLPPYYPPSSNNICQQSLNNSNILQNQQQQQISSSPPLLPSIQQNQFNGIF